MRHVAAIHYPINKQVEERDVIFVLRMPSWKASMAPAAEFLFTNQSSFPFMNPIYVMRILDMNAIYDTWKCWI